MVRHFLKTYIVSLSPDRFVYFCLILWRFGLGNFFKLVFDALNLVFLLEDQD